MFIIYKGKRRTNGPPQQPVPVCFPRAQSISVKEISNLNQLELIIPRLLESCGGLPLALARGNDCSNSALASQRGPKREPENCGVGCLRS